MYDSIIALCRESLAISLPILLERREIYESLSINIC